MGLVKMNEWFELREVHAGAGRGTLSKPPEYPRVATSQPTTVCHPKQKSHQGGRRSGRAQAAQ